VAVVKGMGPCLIPNAKGFPCGRQINEGAPIGTVIAGIGAPLVGHRECAAAFQQRKQNEQREKVAAAMVKRVDQAGPGGALGPERDALLGGIPLAEQIARQEAQKEQANLGEAAAAAGVRSVAEIPFDDEAGTSAVDPATYTQVHEGLTASEQRELEAYKARLLAKRKPPTTLPELADRVARIESVLGIVGVTLDD